MRGDVSNSIQMFRGGFKWVTKRRGKLRDKSGLLSIAVGEAVGIQGKDKLGVNSVSRKMLCRVDK